MKAIDTVRDEIERNADAIRAAIQSTLYSQPETTPVVDTPESPEPLPVTRRGQAIIHAILRHAMIEDRHSGVSAHQSPLAFVLRCLELGAIIHTTNRVEPDYDSLPPRETLPALPPDAQQVCDAVIEDKQGDCVAGVPIVGNAQVPMSLEQRIGWMLASAEDRERWLAKFVAKDKTPALTALQIAGSKHLGLLFAEWP